MPGSDPVSKTVSTLQSAYSLAKDIADLNDAHAVKVQIGELQTQILSAQESALRSQESEAALARQVHELEQRVAQMETWDVEKKRYKLTELPPGVFVYALQKNAEGGEPMHYLCETCFNKGHKSVLHNRGHFNGLDHFECHACDAKINTGHGIKPEVISEYDPLA